MPDTITSVVASMRSASLKTLPRSSLRDRLWKRIMNLVDLLRVRLVGEEQIALTHVGRELRKSLSHMRSRLVVMMSAIFSLPASANSSVSPLVSIA